MSTGRRCLSSGEVRLRYSEMSEVSNPSSWLTAWLKISATQKRYSVPIRRSSKRSLLKWRRIWKRSSFLREWPRFSVVLTSTKEWWSWSFKTNSGLASKSRIYSWPHLKAHQWRGGRLEELRSNSSKRCGTVDLILEICHSRNVNMIRSQRKLACTKNSAAPKKDMALFEDSATTTSLSKPIGKARNVACK